MNAELQLLAERLAVARQAHEYAEHLYKQAEAEWKASAPIAAIQMARTIASDQKKMIEKQAREQIAEAAERGDDLGMYFGVQRRVTAIVPDEAALIGWLIREAPVIARQVLSIDMDALYKLLVNNQVERDGTKQIAPALAEMPARIGEQLTPVIHWSKLPEPAPESDVKTNSAS
jgi:hypothetical protein